MEERQWAQDEFERAGSIRRQREYENKKLRRWKYHPSGSIGEGNATQSVRE